MKIRKATLGDVDQLLQMVREDTRKAAKLYTHGKKRTLTEAEAEYAKLLKKTIRSRSGVVLVAWEEETPAGFAVAHLKKPESILYTRTWGHIKNVYADDQAEQKLLEATYSWMKTKGAENVLVHFNAFNKRTQKVVRQYKKRGFEEYTASMIKKI